MFRLVLVAWLASPATAQQRPGPLPVLDREPLFPLEVGNHWVYQVRGVGAPTTVEVEATPAAPASSPAQAGYVVLRNYFPGSPRTVRRLPGDVVMERDDTQRRERLWYLLRSPSGLSWRLELAGAIAQDASLRCLDGASLTVTKRDAVVRVPAGEFTGVVEVRWQPVCTDAAIVAEWFAPGVGLVRREETRLSGPVVWELVEAKVSQRRIPALLYGVDLRLESPRVTVNRMPGPAPVSAPTLRGMLTVMNLTQFPTTLVFSGCGSATVVVRDVSGREVVRTRVDDGGCCACTVLLPVTVRGIWGLPFSLRLAQRDGSPLADGRYTVEASFDTLEREELRPAGRAGLEIHSVH